MFCVLFLNPECFVYVLRWLVCVLVFTCSHADDERERQLLAARTEIQFQTDILENPELEFPPRQTPRLL